MAGRTVGFSGADLKNLVNEAALMAARKEKQEVNSEDFDRARDKIIMGIEREYVVKEDEKKAQDILTSNRDDLDTLVQSLLEHETLSREEIDEILGPQSGSAVKRVSNQYNGCITLPTFCH